MITTTDITAMDDAALHRLLAWLSPSYPVGAFSYSHGLEWAVEAGDVADAASLRDWIEDLLRHGGGASDAVLFVHAWRAASEGDDAALGEVAELAAAFAPTRERRLETLNQGQAFVAATEAAWATPVAARLKGVWDGPLAYPVAVAIAAASNAVPLGPALNAYLHAYAANLVSAGVRLVPLGQTDGQRATAALAPVIAAAARAAAARSLEDLGGIALRADIASCRHETQYTRLFRS